MKKLIAFATLVVTLLVLGGCNDDSINPYRYDPTQENPAGGTQPTQPSPGTQQKSTSVNVTFDLPDGWIRDEEKSPNRGIQWSASSDGVKPYVLVEASYGGKGTIEEARQLAKKDHEKRMKYCDNAECAKWITYSEKNIAGVDVFISTDVNFYWGADSLSSILWFVKDGIVYGIDFDDPVDAYLDAAKKIIGTIHTIKQ